MIDQHARIAVLRIFLFVALSTAGLCPRSLAVDYFWTGRGGDNIWFNAENWAAPNGGFPNGPEDIAIFNEGSPGATVSLLDTNIQLQAITFDSNDRFEIANGGINFLDAVDLRVVSGDHTISADLNGGGNLGLIKRGAGSLEISGVADLSSDVTIRQGALIVSATLFTNEVFVRPGGGLLGTGKIVGDTFVGSAGGATERQALLGAGDLLDNRLGALTFSGDLTFGTDARTVLEIGEAGADFLSVDGTVAFGGLLEIQLLDEFVPDFGETFRLIRAESHLPGTYFDEIAEVVLPDGEAITIALNSTGADVVLYALRALRGDMNLDMTVNAADDGPLFALALQDADAYDDLFWASNCGAGDCVADFEMADIGDDGSHTFDDLIEFVELVNSMAGEEPLQPAAILAMLQTPSAIPEPSSLALLVGVILLSCLHRLTLAHGGR